MPLTEYRRKRRAGGTPEPIPELDPEATHGERGVFVVHVHDARRKHFDLRLELGGALLSFAVPKGITLDPNVRPLAVRTEEHPLEYIDFEDVIPEGQYGAGPMIVWDRGQLRWLEHPADDQHGKFDFLLYGRKLRGRFSLVPLRDPPNYLLLKKKDRHAQTGATLQELDPRSIFCGLEVQKLASLGGLRAELAKRVRGLAGVRSAASQPELPPHLTEAEAIELWDFVPRGAFRVRLSRQGATISLRSEDGRELAPRYPDVVAALGHGIGDDLCLEALLWPEPVDDLELPQVLALDLLTFAGRDLERVPLPTRRAWLAELFPGAGIVRCLPGHEGRAEQLLAQTERHAPALFEQLQGVLGRSREGVFFVARTQQPKKLEQPSLQADVPVAPTRKLSLTNRQKPFFPAVNLTKGDLLDYYAQIAKVLLPHLRDRPVVLERFPDGVDGKHFFQWRPPPGAPSWLGSMEIPEHRPEKKREPGWQPKRAFLLNDVESLLYVVNLGCIPLHLLAFEVERPALCTFATVDFDVKQSNLATARPLVATLQRLLEHIGLPAYLKTSGKTGLHVLLPLGRGIPFADAQALVEVLGRWLVAEHPETATREAHIEKRGARVYVDTGQTGTIRAIAAPYSVRPVHDARVSMTLPWSALDDVEPARFTVQTVPAWVDEHGDPWRSFRAEQPDLPAALGKLSTRLPKRRS